VAGALFDTVCRSIFHHAAFNADPHPGNFFFPPAGGDADVILLDFGCVRYLERDFVEGWKSMARSVLDGRRGDFPDTVRAVGLVGSKKFDFDAQWEIMRVLYEPFLTPRLPLRGQLRARRPADDEVRQRERAPHRTPGTVDHREPAALRCLRAAPHPPRIGRLGRDVPTLDRGGDRAGRPARSARDRRDAY
jgi:hypothetical protein